MTSILLRPYSDLGAWAVLQRLDYHDQLEAEIMMGEATALALFAQWRALQGQAIASFMVSATAGLRPAGAPFALLGLFQTGQAGVAQAALLACDHKLHRAGLHKLAVEIRRALPDLLIAKRLTRIEARSWQGHPSAARLLRFLGFVQEAECRGFGPGGAGTFLQFAYLPTNPET